MYQQLSKKNTKIAVIGLGYVGLPIALEFGRIFSVIGFDIKKERVISLNNKIDPDGEVPATAFEGSDVLFTNNVEDLNGCSFHIIAVPTPVDEHKVPDLSYLESATTIIAKILKKAIMWCMNQPFFRAVQKKFVCLFLKNNQVYC
jgi:UDP-N-acetyl-D-galactosamine dehydrogenase